jgi:hypothetical protein
MADLPVGNHSHRARTDVLAVVLTHRRGCALAAIEVDTRLEPSPNPEEATLFHPQALSQRLSAWMPRLIPSVSAEGDAEGRSDGVVHLNPPGSGFWKKLNETLLAAEEGAHRGPSSEPQVQTVFESPNRCAWVLTDNQSAESLWGMYRALLASIKRSEKDVAWLACASGPVGSFTGLRIGASFCAGLQLGRPRVVLGVPTFSFADLANLPGSGPAALWDPNPRRQWTALGSEYGASVTGCELMLSLALLLCVGCQPWQNLQVGYSSEPGPVIKLRADGGKSGHG